MVMSQNLTKYLFLLLFLLQVSCAGIVLVEDRKIFPQAKPVQSLTYDIYIPYFRYVPTPVDLRDLCQTTDWSRAYVGKSPLSGLVSIATLGIVSPQHADLSCAN